MSTEIAGARVFPAYLDRSEQAHLVDEIRAVVAKAPLYSPVTRFGKPLSVRMTAAGRFGWFSDRKGYRYLPQHPGGDDWPAIPGSVLEIWRAVSGSERVPECCLINFYSDTARMGLHQDRDEADFSEPVVSISLGDDALFRIGGTGRKDPTRSVWLASGDVVVLGGQARLAYHGIDRVLPGSSTLLKDGGRINLTLRVVT